MNGRIVLMIVTDKGFVIYIREPVLAMKVLVVLIVGSKLVQICVLIMEFAIQRKVGVFVILDTEGKIVLDFALNSVLFMELAILKMKLVNVD